MKKKIIILPLCFVFSIFAKAQMITPSQKVELCPNTEYIFLVELPGLCSNILVYATAQNVTPQVTQGPYNISPNSNITGFNFKGKFVDWNNKQTFTVQYNDAGNVTRTVPFQYTKIKSLRFANNFSQIYPNITSFSAPRCQNTTRTISFTNVQYGNPFENPPIGYGTVANYEYLLPSGWTLNGGSPSTGSNWIAANNNVSITSDLTNGDQTNIRIRSVNNACGIGLQTGQEVNIAISRPAPVMSITPNGSEAYICLGSSKTFTLVGLPANATITSWVSSDPSLATVSSPSPGSSVVVTSVGGSGSITLTANVAQCGFSYAVPLIINLGINVPAVYSISSNYVVSNNNQYQYYSYPYEYGMGQVYQPRNENVLFYSTIDNTFITNPTWSVSGAYNLFYPSTNSFSLYMATPNSGPYSRNIATVRLLANSGCGTVDKLYVFHAIVSSSGFNIIASPNPVKGIINLVITKKGNAAFNSVKPSLPAKQEVSRGKTALSLYSMGLNILTKQWSYNETDALVYSLNVAGIKAGWYVLKMEREAEVATTKILIQ